jgi:hypothetical protein
MERLDAAAGGHCGQPGAELSVASRPGKQAADERPVVEPGPPDDNRQAPAGSDVDNGCRCLVRVPRSRVGFFGPRNVDEMMRNASLLAD